MLVVLASRYDQHVEALVSRWGGEARLLTSEDLSTKGWRFNTDGGKRSLAVIGGEVVDCKEIEGVLTRLPRVSEEDLFNIAPGDRAYVAAEMTAFLAAWLSSLNCPVLNKPTPLCLSGPFLRREMWVHTAARLEIPVHPVNRHSPMLPNEKADSFKSELVSVNIVGDACLGQADESLAEKTRTLARDVGVRLLRARFTGPEEGSLFVDADYWVDLSNPEISDAIFRYLRDRV